MKINVKLLSLAVLWLMVLGGFGAVGTNVVKNHSFEIINPETAEEVNIGEYVTGEVIIGFHKEGVGLDPIDVMFIDSFQGHNIKEKIEVLNVAVVEVNEGEEQDFIDNVIGSPFVEYAELNWILHWWHTPNDPKWNNQWGPKRIKCEEAWDIVQGSSSVKIAIVDTGIDYDHPDLSGNYVSGGKDWVNSDDDPMDDRGHGTHCAGIAAAVMDNNEGVAGVAQVKLMAEKVLSSQGSGDAVDIANGITHAADNGADIISMSLGGPNPVSVIENACDYAYDDKGIVIVAASGNDYSSTVSYPARYSSVIAVGATNQENERCPFSNYGQNLELMAPGKDILSTMLDDVYEYNTGTSMACPHVAGVAALVLSTSVDPYYDFDNDGEWDNNEVRQKMDDTAFDLGPSGWDQEYGYGLVDASAAVGGNGPPKPRVNVEIYKLTNDPDTGDFEQIDHWWWPNNQEPEWFYRVGVESGGEQQYQHNYNKDLEGWWEFQWIGEYTWNAQQGHLFTVDTSTLEVTIKLMDHDPLWEGGADDLADVSAYTGGGKNDDTSDKRSAIYTGTYDIVEDELINTDEVTYEGGYIVTKGAYGDDPANNAKVWFKITDNYEAENYKPDLEVDPTSINFGNVKQGETVTKTFKIKNTADIDPLDLPENRYLNWNLQKPSWVEVDKTSGSLTACEEEEITVTIDTGNMAMKPWEDFITITSNGGNAEIKVTITVPHVKTLDSLSYAFLQSVGKFLPWFFNVFSKIIQILPQ